MTKKHRTGLQSKISHIFAGVPIPKKSRPDSKSEKPEPEQNASELTPSQKEVQIEETITKKQPIPSKLPEEEQPVVEPSTEKIVKNKEGITAEEKNQESSSDKPIIEEPVLEIKNEAPPTQKPVIEQQPKLKPVSKKTMPTPKIPEADEPFIERREVLIDKPAAPIGSKFNMAKIREPAETQMKPPLSRTLKADVAQTKTIQSTRKTPQRLKSKRVAKKPETNPTKQKTMIALIVVLSIVLVLLLVKPFDRFSKNTQGSTATAINNSQVPAASNFQAIEIDWPEPPIYNSDVLRDPMELSQATQESKELIVKGISFFQGKPLATIGEEQYEVGEEVISGVKIIEITENYVKFEKDDKAWTQYIGE